MDKGQNLTLKMKNGIVDPTSIQKEAQNTTDLFLSDLYEIATNEQMVELSVSRENTYRKKGEVITKEFLTPKDVDDNTLDKAALQLLRSWGEPIGKHIQGNLGQTLTPEGNTQSGIRSTNDNVQIIINGKGSLNQRTVGVAHEFGHVVLYLRGLPFSHGQKGVDPFVYGRSSFMSKRLGYDY